MALKRKSKQDQQLLWRPDFRDAAALPDTKVVRTNFLYNFIVITLTVALFGYCVLQEYNLQSAKAYRETIRLQVESGMAANRQLLEFNRRWIGNAASVHEAIRFHQVPVDYAGFIRQLSVALPDGIVLGTIQLAYADPPARSQDPAAFVISLTGKIAGGDFGSPADILQRLQQCLRDLEELQDRIEDMTVAQFNRDNQLGVFNFALSIRVAPNPTIP